MRVATIVAALLLAAPVHAADLPDVDSPDAAHQRAVESIEQAEKSCIANLDPPPDGCGLTLERLCQYRAFSAAGERYPALAREAVKAEQRAESLSDRPTHLRAALWGGGASVLGVAVGVVVGVVVVGQ